MSVRSIVCILQSVLLLTGCFESGPLGTGTGPGPKPDLGTFDLGPPKDTALPDQLDDLEEDIGDVATDDGPPADAVSCDADPACLGMSSDLCKGEMRCIDSLCQHDPAVVVECVDTGNSCTDSTCNAATGLCETTYLATLECTCNPVAQLICGSSFQQSTGDLGETKVLSDYACGPAGGSRSEHTWLFTAASDGIVSVSAVADAIGGVYVLGYDGTRCVPEACIAGGEFGAAFQAQAGSKYGIIVEHPEGLPVSVDLSLQCGITDEYSCDNGVDDDLNALTDCADPFCAETPACAGVPESDCDDDVDNDADGLTDCADGDCVGVGNCDQTCSANTSTVCNQTYQISTTGGKANADTYSCGPDAFGKEVAYILPGSINGDVTVSLAGGPNQRLYILRDQGSGCTPFACETSGTTTVSFNKPAGTTWYAVVDSDIGDEGPFSITITCP